MQQHPFGGRVKENAFGGRGLKLRLPESFLVGLVSTPSLDFRCKASDSYDLILEDIYEPPFFIDTRKVPVVAHLTSQ